MNMLPAMHKMENYISNRKLWGIITVVFVSLLVTFYCQFPFFKNKYILPDDVRQEIFWMFKFQDKEIFSDDIFLRYSSLIAPIGVKYVYFLTSFFADALIIVKLLPFFLCAVSALYIFGLGKLLRNNTTGILLAVLYVLVAWYRELIFFEDGAAGSFFPVLLAAFLFYFVKKDYLKCFFTLIVQIIFYPPALLICLFAYGVSFVKYRQKQLYFERNKKKLIYFFIVAVICFFILVPKYILGPKEFGKIVTLSQMRDMPEFYPEIKYRDRIQPRGRAPFFYSSLFLRLINKRSGLALNGSTKFLGIICLILLFFLKRKALEFPIEIWYFLAASCFLFILANIMALRLFEPSRYVRVSIPVFLVIFFVVNSGRWISIIRKGFYKKIIIIFLIVVVAVFYLPRIKADTDYWGEDAELYKFLSTLPKDILVAGHPRNIDNIPTFAKRKVLVLEELSLPYYSKFYNMIKKRSFGFFNAYYATSSEEFYKFCSEYGITHFVVYKKHFTDDYLNSSNFYISPFNNYIINLVHTERRNEFILNRVPENKKLFTSQNCFVIQCNRKDLFN